MIRQIRDFIFGNTKRIAVNLVIQLLLYLLIEQVLLILAQTFRNQASKALSALSNGKQ